ncbi:hypothetical protein [Haloarcula litorea]|uniref:hypothetical protein n=1 Tax=Haloarcula litorea TaxID=3032579 RepID=UPI0023E8E45D|nr:hypothetical protein [Halomicroarcula sp. GDY20]
MADVLAGRRPSLLAWTLATLDAAVFVLVAVLAAHATGALAGLLAGLNTLVGVVAFLLLWGLFVVAVRWVLADASLAESSLGTLAARGVAAGGVAGIGTVLAVVGVAVVPSVLTGGIEPLSVALIALVGSGVAAVVGSVVGLLLGLVDLALFRVAGAVVPAPAEREGAPPATPDRP